MARSPNCSAANASGEFSSDVIDVLSWSRTRILAFGWYGSRTGEFLLDTNGPGGGLLADSRLALCPPSQTFSFSYLGYLTPDGTKIIMPVAEPVKPGQRLRACLQTTRPPRNGRIFPKLEEFSATTGKAIGVIYNSPSSPPVLFLGYNVEWSNASGSVLVLDGPAGPGPRAPLTYGVLTGGTFTPIPGAPSPVSSLIAF